MNFTRSSLLNQALYINKLTCLYIKTYNIINAIVFFWSSPGLSPPLLVGLDPSTADSLVSIARTWPQRRSWEARNSLQRSSGHGENVGFVFFGKKKTTEKWFWAVFGGLIFLAIIWCLMVFEVLLDVYRGTFRVLLVDKNKQHYNVIRFLKMCLKFNNKPLENHWGE